MSDPPPDLCFGHHSWLPSHRREELFQSITMQELRVLRWAVIPKLVQRCYTRVDVGYLCAHEDGLRHFVSLV